MEQVRLRAIVVASVAGLLFGFDTAVISGVTEALRSVFSLTPGQLGWAVSAALWGTLVGALTFGIPGDRFGSRTMLRAVGLLYLASALGCALAGSLATFAVFRFLGGLAIGGSSVLAPVYISEIAPSRRRGLLVGLFQFNIVLGILLAYLSNFMVAEIVANASAWRFKLGVAGLPALAFALLTLGIPHSPRWLLAKGRRLDSLAALRWLGDTNPQRTIVEIEKLDRAADGAGERLSWALHRKPVLLAILIGVFNQLSGINAILYYLNDIFRAAGFSRVSADVQAVAIGVTNLAFTVAAMALIDRVGRKPLLLIGSVGTGAALTGAAAIFASGQDQWLLLWVLVAFVAFFAISQGAVIWVYISEIFPTRVRARGQSLGSASHWISNAVISQLFPIVAAHTRALPFWFFAGCMALQLLVVWLFFPETKRVSLERMQDAVEPGIKPDGLTEFTSKAPLPTR